MGAVSINPFWGPSSLNATGRFKLHMDTAYTFSATH